MDPFHFSQALPFTHYLPIIQLAFLVCPIILSLYTALYLLKKYKKDRTKYDFIHSITIALQELNEEEYSELLKIYKIGRIQLSQESAAIAHLRKHQLIIESANVSRRQDGQYRREVSYVINYDIQDIIKGYFKE